MVNEMGDISNAPLPSPLPRGEREHWGAIILCGGRSTRMGKDKATLPFGPEFMLERVVRLVSSVVNPSSVVVVAAEDQPLPELPESVIVARDEQPDRGPLEGLAAGLRALPPEAGAAYATSCDVPLIEPEFIHSMFARLAGHEIAVPVDGKFYHPLAAVYRRSVLPAVESLLAAERLRPRFLFDETDTAAVPVDDLRESDPELLTLMNLNYEEEYHTALEKAGFR